MAKICQRFDFLSLDQANEDLKIVEEKDKKTLGAIRKKRSKNFIPELKNTGYTVLISSTSSSGIPASVIMCGEHNQSIGSDFFEITNKLRLCFVKKHFYSEAN